MGAGRNGGPFRGEVRDDLDRKGATIAKVTLHVGFGSFQPVRVEEVEAHRMHSERYRISKEVFESLSGKRVLAVGTTALRALESAYLKNSLEGETDLFIYPGFQFNVVRRLLTNFHLPKSTLLMLVTLLLWVIAFVFTIRAERSRRRSLSGLVGEG